MPPPATSATPPARSAQEVSPGSGLGRLAAITLVGLLAYSNTFGVPFHFDDPNVVLLDPAARDLAGFFTSPTRASRIVGLFTFALNGSLHGTSVLGFHAVNLAIHVAAAICLYSLTALACRTAQPAAPALRDGASGAGLLAALLFVSHPVQTQAVTYIVQRLASLAALFFLCAALTYAHAVLAPSPRRRALLFALSALLAVLALFTKENAVSVPLALLLVDLALLPGTPRQRVTRLAPFFALVAVAATSFLGAADAVSVAGAEFRDRTAEGGVPAWLAYVLTQPAAVLRYLRLLVFPSGQTIDYDQPLFSSFLSPQVLVPSGALVVLLGAPALLAWRARRRSALARLVLLGLGWFVVGLSVECVVPLADVVL